MLKVCVCGIGPVALNKMRVLLARGLQSIEKASGYRFLGSTGIMRRKKGI